MITRSRRFHLVVVRSTVTHVKSMDAEFRDAVLEVVTGEKPGGIMSDALDDGGKGCR